MNPNVFGGIRGGSKAEAMPETKRNLAVVARILSSRSNQILFVLLAVVIGTLYTILLPFEFTQRFSFANWNYLDPYLAAWSIVLGIGMSLVLVLEIYAVRRIRSRQAGSFERACFYWQHSPKLSLLHPNHPNSARIHWAVNGKHLWNNRRSSALLCCESDRVPFWERFVVSSVRLVERSNNS